MILFWLACAAPSAWPPVQVEDPAVATPPVEEEEPAAAAPTLRINELMPDNESSLEDEHGEEPDWVELINLGSEAVDLGGHGLGDKPGEGPLSLIAEGTVLQPGERLLFYLDGRPERGPRHLDVKLDSDGGTLVLYDPDGAALDSLSWPSLPADVVRGRFPDGAESVASSILATPGNANPWEPGTSLDPSEALFPQDRVLTLHLHLPAESLRSLAAAPSTWVEGAVSFEGVTLSPIGVRIKGQWGSLRSITGKAALKLSLDEFGGSAELRGLQNLTLNNMVQDPSLVNERVAYRLFRAMGVPAPRTAHVALYLNGEYRGLYLHVESPDERFLARWFENAEGNLYEGEYGQDLSLSGYLSLEQDERGADDPDDYSDLAALAALLAQSPTEARVPELAALVDIDEVLAMLAVEVIIGHWDGYFWYPNNYRVYHDPSTGQLSLLPWGVDQTFAYDGGIESPSGLLARWMLQIPSLRARYRLALWRAAARMEALALDEEAQQAHALVLPWFRESGYEEHSVETSLAWLRVTTDFIAARPAVIEGRLFED